MRFHSIRQLFALAILALFAPAAQAQFQQLYYYGTTANPVSGAFRDVQVLNTDGPNGENIVAVGSTSPATVNGVMAFHDVNGTPVSYLEYTNPAGNNVEAEAICNTPSNRLVACFFDPVSFATDVVVTNSSGGVAWTARIPNMRIRDVVASPSPGPGGESIWLVGNTNAPNISAVGLDGVGGLIFAREYFIGPGYGNTLGYEIDHSGTTNRLTIVGKSSINGCTDGILAMRLALNGNVLWGNVYSDPTCTREYKGKALVQRPGPGNRYIIAFEHKDPAIPANTFAGLMEISMAGAFNWGRYYQGAGFFNGTDFLVRGLDAHNTGLLLSGRFQSSTNPPGQFSGYSLSTNLNGFAIQFNEYETTGAWTPRDTRLNNMDWSPGDQTFVIVGQFVDDSSVDAWPIAPVEPAFWMVKALANGDSECSTSDNPDGININPNVDGPTFQFQTYLPTQSPLQHAAVDPFHFKQCSSNKRGFGGGQLAEGAQVPTVAYLQGQGRILVEIPSGTEGGVRITLLDLQGRTLLSGTATAGSNWIDAGQVSAGVYLLRYEGAGLRSGVKKIAIH